MTLPELLVVVLLLLAGAGSGALALAADAGPLGVFAAAFGGLFALPAIAGLAALLDGLVHGPSRYPHCPCGALRHLPYERDDQHGLVRRCACGTAFVRRGGGVLRLGADRVARTYRRWHPLRRRWEPWAAPGPPETPYR